MPGTPDRDAVLGTGGEDGGGDDADGVVQAEAELLRDLQKLGDALVGRLDGLACIIDEPERDWSMAALAQAGHTTERHLLRLFLDNPLELVRGNDRIAVVTDVRDALSEDDEIAMPDPAGRALGAPTPWNAGVESGRSNCVVAGCSATSTVSASLPFSFRVHASPSAPFHSK